MHILVRIAIVILLIGIQPFLWGYVADRSRQLHLAQTNEEQFVLLSQKLIEAQQVFSQAQPSILKLAESFPSSTTISQVVGRIEALADSNSLGIELKSIEDMDPLEAGQGKILRKRITTEVTGPVDSLFSFLETMENQKEVLSIQSWDIVNTSEQQSIFKMTLHTIYYFYDGQTT